METWIIHCNLDKQDQKQLLIYYFSGPIITFALLLVSVASPYGIKREYGVNP